MTVVDTNLNAGVLASLPAALRNDAALTSLLGTVDGTVAVPEVARAVAIAALAELSGRRPIVVACPTSTLASQLADDLTVLVPADEVALFPAWETLPFERVSPSVETMGRRLEVLWRLQDESRTPRIVVASMRALLQQLGPDTPSVSPVIVRKGDTLDPDELLRALVNGGYRREELVEHRGEVAKRGAIIDVFPSTADAPIRIDLWGDEVDRLTTFSVHDQRSDVDLDEAVIFPARELVLSDEVRDRARSLVASEPWGREQWERLGEGALFDGMESWLPWLTA
ncbi:MAG: transcription-repair coupling factor, partial [Actinobacteria bacterium]|nr:transcription-repair coupling factor [Actinomycetota bacterium]